ncbi:hypothetical protein BGZ94_003463 [Podila epigama]|nr:hypothetical protein BGZ94_003463 [Podila epigama]
MELVFAKGHQSAKALEFILWFLFQKLDMSRAQKEFKGCWPILDRNDAREFRNVAFKWMEQLRKDGCFNLGLSIGSGSSSLHSNGLQQLENITHTSQRQGSLSDSHLPQATRTRTISFSSTTSSMSRQLRTGLALFVPTIRRSYLDESIGERIEQLVLILSTYVLSQVVQQTIEDNQKANSSETPTDVAYDKELLRLAGSVPGSQYEEEEALGEIEAQIETRAARYAQEVERKEDARNRFEAQKQELDARTRRVSLDLAALEEDRQREQSILRWPYRRLLTTLPTLEGSQSTRRSGHAESIQAEALEKAERLSQHFATSPKHDEGSRRIKDYVRQSVQELNQNHPKALLTALGIRAIFSAPPMPIRKVPAVTCSSLSKPSLRVPLEQAHGSVLGAKTASPLIKSVIRPPAAAAPRRLDIHSGSVSTRRTEITSRIAIKKPSPADLITPRSLNRSASYEELCEEIVSSLTVENEGTMTPPRCKSGPFRPLSKLPSSNTLVKSADSHASKANIVGSTIPTPLPMDGNRTLPKGRSPFLASLMRSRTVTSLRESRVVGSSSDYIASQHSSHASSHHPSASVIGKSSVGSSKKRRQSSDFPELSRPHLAPSTPEPKHSAHLAADVTEGEIVVREQMSNPFQDSDDGDVSPNTPSKRRRLDLTEHTIDLENKRPSDDYDRVQSGYLFPPNTPNHKTAKASCFTGLTLHDLRAPTPKTERTYNLQTGSPLPPRPMPIMFLHTPQQKKLYEEMAARSAAASKSPLPSPPAKPNLGLPTFASKSTAVSPARNPVFSSSIFSRFNFGSTPDHQAGVLLESPVKGPKSNNAPMHSMTKALDSPLSLPCSAGSKSAAFSTRTPRVTEKTMGSSTRVHRLLSGNSVTLDRMSHVDNKGPGCVATTEQGAISSPLEATSDEPTHSIIAINDSTKRPRVQAMKRQQKSSETTPSSSATSNPSPWGRPPSWKPKSPRMIDMEKKRMRERTARLAAKFGPVPIAFDMDSKQSLGSLKVSVYGKPTNTGNSISSQSSMSLGSSIASLHNKSTETLREAHDRVEEDDEENGDDEYDSGSISPTAVSPIKGSQLFSQSTFQPFASLFSTRDTGMFSRSTAAQFHTPYPATRPSLLVTKSDAERNAKEATRVSKETPRTVASPSPFLKDGKEGHEEEDEDEEAERRRVLDGPMTTNFEEDDRSTVRVREEEEETILHKALQSIFAEGTKSSGDEGRKGERLSTRRDSRLFKESQGSERGFGQEEMDGESEIKGLFDERMPDGLDLDEALWETTEVYT